MLLYFAIFASESRLQIFKQESYWSLQGTFPPKAYKKGYITEITWSSKEVTYYRQLNKWNNLVHKLFGEILSILKDIYGN